MNLKKVFCAGLLMLPLAGFAEGNPLGSLPFGFDSENFQNIDANINNYYTLDWSAPSVKKNDMHFMCVLSLRDASTAASPKLPASVAINGGGDLAGNSSHLRLGLNKLDWQFNAPNKLTSQSDEIQITPSNNSYKINCYSDEDK